MPDYQLYNFKNLTTKEVQLLGAVKARGVDLDADLFQLEQSGVCDPAWLEWGRKYLALGIDCVVRLISKQGGF